MQRPRRVRSASARRAVAAALHPEVKYDTTPCKAIPGVELIYFTGNLHVVPARVRSPATTASLPGFLCVCFGSTVQHKVAQGQVAVFREKRPDAGHSTLSESLSIAHCQWIGCPP